jgi:hypothetical protein
MLNVQKEALVKKINEFDAWYKKLNKSKDEDDFLEFVWEIMETPYTEYHYSLIINKNTNKLFKEALWSRFDEHTDAETFLLDKLDKNFDMEFHGEILFCLGKIIDLNNGKQKINVLEYAKEFTKNSNANTREKAIIVLGWLGGNKEIELLGNILLNDTNNKCRAWSASSFMQISFRKKINIEKVLPYFYKSIKQEQDNFVVESVINALQEITGKKFGLKKKDMDINNIKAVNNSKIRVLKYFEKLYGE